MCTNTILGKHRPKEGKPSGLKQKEHQEASKEGKKKWKWGKYKKILATTH
jgi:hypothetical protein